MDEKPNIPSTFYNSETGAPFTECLMCQKELVLSQSIYLIEKVLRRVPNLDLEEVLFEYAICLNCAEKTHDEMSEESKEAIERYFAQNLKHEVIQKDGDRLNWCLFTGKPLENSSELSYHAQCKGDKLIESIFPYAVSDEAMDQIVKVLSKKTLDDLDDFRNTYFGGPPELEEILRPRRLLPF